MENLTSVIKKAQAVEAGNRVATNTEDAARQLLSRCLQRIADFRSSKPNVRKVVDAAKAATNAKEGEQLTTAINQLITDRAAVSLFIRLVLNQVLNFTIINDQRHAVRAGTEAPQQWQLDSLGQLKIETDPERFTFADTSADIIYDASVIIKDALETVYLALFPQEPCLAWKQVAEVDEEDGTIFYRDIEDRNQALLLTQRENEEYRARQEKEREEKLQRAITSVGL